MRSRTLPQIYLAIGSSTGVSVVAGDPVDTVSDLPEHRIELHQFRSSDAAGAFVAGLDLASAGNTIGWTWEHESRASNAVVIVARFDETRPDVERIEDAVALVAHDESGLDSQAHRVAMDGIFEQRRRDEVFYAERRAPLLAALDAADIRVGQAALDWVRTSLALIQRVKDGYLVSGAVPVDDVHAKLDVAGIAEEVGLRLQGDGHEFAAGPFETPDEAVASLRLFEQAARIAEDERKRQHWAIFEASMKVTSARRRFLTAAAEDGAYVGVHRNSRYARAGAHEVKASELESMLRIGWLEIEDRRAQITEKGREAIGLGAAAPAP